MLRCRQGLAVQRNSVTSRGERGGNRGLREAVLHVAASRIDSPAALQVDGEAVPAVVELISALPDVGAEVAEARAVGIGSDPYVLPSLGGDGGGCRLLLFEAALVVYVGALSPYIYIMVSRAVVDFRVERKRPPG